MKGALLTSSALVTFVSVTAAQTCQPHWTNDLPGQVGEVRVLRVFDNGSGPALYVATAGEGNAVKRWNGARVQVLGTTAGSLPQSYATGVYSLEMFDDGAGIALYIGGAFTSVNGTPANAVAKWTGAAWQPLGLGMDRNVRALLAYDDGSGPALYAGGLFTSADGAPASSIARWDGAGWSPLGSGLSGGITTSGPVLAYPGAYTLAAFDDGSGRALYAGGLFAYAGGSPAAAIARWKNGAWEPVGNGLSWNGTEQALVISMKAYAGPAGPALYLGGRVNFGALNQNPLVVRWDGIGWHPVGGWLPGYYVSSFAEAEFWGVNTLHASIYPYATLPSQGSVFRLSGNEWVPIGVTGSSPVRALLTFDDGGGKHLLAGGGFTSVSGVAAARLARWTGCPDSCYADCDGNGLSASDFACFQSKFVAADPYADCNFDSVLTVADFGCFQTKFAAGCP